MILSLFHAFIISFSGHSFYKYCRKFNNSSGYQIRWGNKTSALCDIICSWRIKTFRCVNFDCSDRFLSNKEPDQWPRYKLHQSSSGVGFQSQLYPAERYVSMWMSGVEGNLTNLLFINVYLKIHFYCHSFRFLLIFSSQKMCLMQDQIRN